MCRTFFPVIASVQDSRPLGRVFRVNSGEHLQKERQRVGPSCGFTFNASSRLVYPATPKAFGRTRIRCTLTDKQAAKRARRKARPRGLHMAHCSVP